MKDRAAVWDWHVLLQDYCQGSHSINETAIKGLVTWCWQGDPSKTVVTVEERSIPDCKHSRAKIYQKQTRQAPLPACPILEVPYQPPGALRSIFGPNSRSATMSGSYLAQFLSYIFQFNLIRFLLIIMVAEAWIWPTFELATITSVVELC